MNSNYAKILIGFFVLSLTTKAEPIGFSKLPNELKDKPQQAVSFTENKGQVSDQNNRPRPDVMFSGVTNGMVYHLRNNGISYQLNRIDTWKTPSELEGMPSTRSNNNNKIPGQTTVYRLDINWKGINKDFTVQTENTLEGCNNYYLVNSEDGSEGVKSYEGVFYKNIYNNIDLHYYKKDNTLKYDYIVAPGADYKQIELQVAGAESIKVQSDGSLVFDTPLGKIEEGAPVVFQNGKQLAAKWIVKKNVLSFDIENYDSTKELIIDPATRVWGTYYGGTGNEFGQSTSIDASGNVFLAGYTNSSLAGVIATAGSHQTTFGGGTNDAFLVKFNSAGVRQWGTYYGGAGNDFGYSCKTDASGNVFLTGYTGTATSALIASAGCHQAAYGGSNDAFLVKFNATGVRQWGTYYGGTGGDIAYACATDAAGNVYITGYSSSTVGTAIATAGSHQTTMGGAFDAFVAKFSAAGVRQWGTYYGGTGGEYGYGCATDAAGNVFITGFTNSSGGTVIATVGSHQAAFGGGDDAFLVKFNTSGVRQWGTYYGDAIDNDYSYSCTTDISGNVYIAGLSSSSNAIASVGSHQSVYGGGYDAFLAKFNTSGVRQWSTYYGDSGYDEGQSCSTDGSGNVYLAGYSSTFIGNAIASVGTYQVANGGGNDAFLAKFNSGGVRQWGTYYGGLGNDLGFSCVAMANDYVYLSGRSSTTTGGIISSTGSHQVNSGGNDDAYLVKFCNQPDLPTNLTPVSNQTMCAGNSTTLSAIGAGSISWFANATGGAPITTGTVYITPVLTAGTYTYYVEANTCTVSPTRTPITVTVSAYPVITVNSGTICAGKSFTMVPSGAATYTFQGGNAVVTPTANSTYTVIGSSAYGCLSATYATASVSIVANPTITVNSGPVCAGNSFTMVPSGAATYTFQGGSAVVTPTANSTYTVIGSSGAGCLSGSVTSSVTVNSNPTITVNNGTICVGKSFTIVPSGAISYTYQGGSAVVSPASNTSYTVVGSNAAGCVSNPVSSFITVNALPVVSAISSFSVICEGQNVNITAGGAVTYTWNTGSTSAVIAVSPTVTSSYTVTGTDANGCTKAASTTVSVNLLPPVNVSSSSGVLCIGQNATLTASGAATYIWNTTATTAVITVTPPVTMSYTVTGTSAAGCTKSAFTTVTVNPLPIVNINPNFSTICLGKTTTLTASGATTYTWNTGAGTSAIPVSPTVATSYTVNATNANGCANTATATVNVNPLPIVSIVSGTNVVCDGQSVSLTAGGANTYSWSTGANTAIITESPSVTITYSVIGTAANGCSNTAMSTVTVNPLPGVTAVAGSSAICIAQSVTLTAGGANTYTWSTGANNIMIADSPTITTTYSVTGKDANGCMNTASTTVNVNPLPVITAVPSSSAICTGQTVTLTASGASTYTWNTSATTVVIADSPTVNTIYSVNGIDANGCANTATASVIVNALPTITIATSNSLICTGQTSTLTASGATSYTWNPGALSGSNVAVSPTVSTTFTVDVMDANGCMNTDTITQLVSPCLGVDAINQSREILSVYPNPSTGVFTLIVPEEVKITITDIFGKVIYDQHFAEGKHSVNMSEFADGLYVLRAGLNGGVKTIRLIKE